MKQPSPKLNWAISNRCDRLQFQEVEVRSFFQSLALALAHSLQGELSVAFLDDEQMTVLHERFFNLSTPTDVITFPGGEDEDFAGEICVSAETAWRESRQRQISFRREMCLYLAHGWLHLIGFDDIEDEDREAMRRAEKEILETAEGSGPLPAFSFESSLGTT